MAGVNSNWVKGSNSMAVALHRACPLCGLFLVFAVLAGGCNPEDAERMARLGRKVAARAETVTIDQLGDLQKGWQAVPNGWQEATLAGRVSARLRWDKKLTDCQIQASATGASVELKGTVRDLDQRRRALDLAEATTGVEKVTDALEIAAP
jgi:osmotically-inducible protein OsmY